MSYEWFIAKRYMQASRRAGFVSFITGFAILGVTIGTAAVIIALSILGGFEKEIKEKVFGFTSHVQVVGFQNQPLGKYRRSAQLVLEKLPNVKALAPFVAREAMMRAGDRVDGILLKGIDAQSNVSTPQRYLVQGRYISDFEARVEEIVIGRKLAIKMSIDVGDKVVVFGLPRQSIGGGTFAQPRAMAFQVVGIFESGMAEYDDIYVFTALQNAQKLFQLGDAVLGFDILVSDVGQASHVASGIQALLGYPYHARTAAQLYRNLFSWIELQKKPAPILLGLIVIVATVNIIGALLLLVLEKTHDIGVLKSIGASYRGIRKIFFIQGAFIGLVGVTMGNVLAYGLCRIQLTFKIFSLPSDIYFMTAVPILLWVGNFVLVSVVVLALCAFASLIPSRAVAKLDPMIMLRFT